MMPRTRELKLKLRAGEDVGLKKLLTRHSMRRHLGRCTTTLLGHGLATLGISLCRRVENGIGIWELTLPRPAGDLTLEEQGGPADVPPRVHTLLAAALRNRAIECGFSLGWFIRARTVS